MSYRRGSLNFQQMVFAFIIIGWGFAVLFLYGSVLIQWNDWSDFKLWSGYLPCIAFYLDLPLSQRYPLLWIRLMIAVLQIFAGAWFLFFDLKALFVLRVLAITGLFSVLLNPYYSNAAITLYLIPYLMIVLFTHHERNVLPCLKQAMAQRDPSARRIYVSFDEEKGCRFSKGVILLGMLEIVLGAFLIREGLWNVPLEGWPILMKSRFGLELVLHMSRAMFINAGVFLSVAGVLLLGHRQTGRMLNMILAVVGFIVSCVLVFVMNPPSGKQHKIMFLILMSVLLIVFAMIYFLLTNPTVMRQFHHRRNLSGSIKIMRTLGVIAFLVILFSLVHLLFHTFVYETAHWTAPRPGYRVVQTTTIIEQSQSSFHKWQKGFFDKTRKFIHKLQPQAELPSDADK